GTAPATSFPAIAHACCPAGHDEVVPRAEEHIARGQDEPAALHRREVNLCAQFGPVGDNLAEHAQPRHATIRKNVEAEVREAARSLDVKPILKVTAQAGEG